ncbi:hypothetical protein Ahy_B02g059254 [Arachis hypogaea]|uniref:Mutator sub-class protein n=1 Tax=Arachis hypogaea TaxID=3818 RepID=A0A445AGF9_ARAHY|nr:hypothetical protein Ahy_B02g059254 [Arachis hypogaea]
MASEESFLVLVHYRGSIKRKTRSGVKFTDKDPLCIILTPTTTYDALVSCVLDKLGLEGVKRVKKFFYRIPTAVLHDTVKFDCSTIGSNEDLQVMFLCRRQFPEVRTPELLAKLVDVVSSSGGSNRNANTIAAVAGSSSRPAVASSSAPVYEPPMQPVASPSFAIDLGGNVGDEVRHGEHIPTEVHCPTPAGVGDEWETSRISKTVVTVKGQLTSPHVCWRLGTCTCTTMQVPPTPNCSDPSPQAEQHKVAI